MTLPKVITHKEISIVYGLSIFQAQHKLATIRAILRKKRFQNLLIAEFCQAENVDQSIFENQLKKEFEKIHAKP